MPLPKDKKSPITLGRVAAVGGLIAGLIASGGTIFSCAEEWSAIKNSPAAVATLEVKVDSLDAIIDNLLDMHGDHLDANISAWEMHTGFPMKASHPTLEDGD